MIRSRTNCILLLDGMVGLCMDSLSGDKSILTVLDKKGEIFGEVYMFIENNQYDYYALVLKKSVVLEIPKVFFFLPEMRSAAHIIQN